jgi:hypothetical protein
MFLRRREREELDAPGSLGMLAFAPKLLISEVVFYQTRQNINIKNERQRLLGGTETRHAPWLRVLGWKSHPNSLALQQYARPKQNPRSKSEPLQRHSTPQRTPPAGDPGPDPATDRWSIFSTLLRFLFRESVKAALLIC